MCVSTSAMLSGIGGAALFIPIFVIIFRITGPEYPLTTSAAIGSALMTEVFGFSSGFIGYYRRRLIDFKSAIPFLTVSIPIAVVGALMFGILQHQETLLKAAYAVLMLVLCMVILRHNPSKKKPTGYEYKENIVHHEELRIIIDRDGKRYNFPKPKQGVLGVLFTTVGSFLTGFLGVGVGETILPPASKTQHGPSCSSGSNFRIYRYRHNCLCLIHTNCRINRSWRTKRGTMEPRLLHNPSSNYGWSDRPTTAGAYSTASYGKGHCYIICSHWDRNAVDCPSNT